MIYIGANRLLNDIRANLWKLALYDFTGIITIPRSGFIPATIIAEELHLGICSFYEFFDHNGSDKVFKRHGQRPVEHDSTDTYLVMDDSCCRGSMGSYVKNLKEAFPEKIFISCVCYIDGPCNLYEPDICLVDFRRDNAANYDQTKDATVLYFYNILDGWWNFRFLYDLDGIMCANPPDDSNTSRYEDYLRYPMPLHLPVTPSGNKIDICTYRLDKYERETRTFLENNNVNYGKLFMFPAATREIRNLTPSAYYKAEHYKDPKYVLFIESNDKEAQDICNLSGKPVYCYESGRMYKTK